MSEDLIVELENWLDSQEFFDLMQTYRHTPITSQAATVEAFDEVRRQILIKVSKLWQS